MTEQYLKDQTNQRKRDCRDKVLNKNEKTALTRHHFEVDDTFNFEEIKMVGYEPNYSQRIPSEIIYIAPIDRYLENGHSHVVECVF